jgi:ComF family protein
MKNIFWDLLFPSYCIICEKPGECLCRECFESIPINSTELCPVCQKAETFAGRVCNVCENENKKIYLDGVIIASYYKHPVLREAIYHYKYGFVQKLAWPLAKTLVKKLFLLETFPFEEFSFTPVPLHEKRHEWRGFNQAELLGKKLQKILSQNQLDINFLPDLLVREKYIKPQMKIHSTLERKKNIVGCFSVNKELTKKLPEKIIIMDDVITTGATLEECAKVLKRRGVRKVWGLVLARQKH